MLNLNGFNNIDFHAVVTTFRKSLDNELDFRKEVSNGLKAAKNFANHDDIYIPRYFTRYCSQRVITMEFVRGVRINDAQAQKELGLDPLESAAVLNRAMAEMIFKHGHVHCDAHPGNILIRQHPNEPKKPQLILLDHGMYRHYSKAFLHLYSRLFLSAISQNYDEMYQLSRILNLEEFARFLPLILLWKRRDSKLGEGIPKDKERLKKVREENRAEFGGLEKVNQLLKRMPENMMFIMRASNLVGLHNMVLGGNNRGRLMEFGRVCIETLYGEDFDAEDSFAEAEDEFLTAAFDSLKQTLDEDRLRYRESVKGLEPVAKGKGVFRLLGSNAEVKVRFFGLSLKLWLIENLVWVYNLIVRRKNKFEVF